MTNNHPGFKKGFWKPEFGGTICRRKCCKDDGTQLHTYFITGPTVGDPPIPGSNYPESYTRLSNQNSDGKFTDICPHSSVAVGGYHSHPLSKGGFSVSLSKSDHSRFDPQTRSRKDSIRIRQAQQPALKRRGLYSAHQVPMSNDPEFVGGMWADPNWRKNFQQSGGTRSPIKAVFHSFKIDQSTFPKSKKIVSPKKPTTINDKICY